MAVRVMRVAAAVALCALFAFPLHAQHITIVEKTTLAPVDHVTVVNPRSGYSTLSDTRGRADIERTQPGDTLYIQHLAYYPVRKTLAEIRGDGGRVVLRERLLNLEEVVVSANKWEQNRRDIPHEIATISPREIAFRNPQTAADMLAGMNGVFVQKSQMGGGSPVLRGFEANKVLIVVDGVRLNNAIYRSGHLQNVIMLDPGILENAEVVFGPGSVIYGSDALGGVMDFHTRRPRLSFDGGTDISGHSWVRYATANLEKSGHVDVNLGFERIGFLTSLTFSDYSDLRAGNIHNPFYPDWGKRFEYVDRIDGEDVVVKNDNPNVQKGTAYSQYNLLQKIRYTPDALTNFEYSFHYSSGSDIPRYDRLAEYRDGQLRYAEWKYGPQTWMMHALAADLSTPTALYDHLRVTAAFQQVDEDRIDRRFGSADERHREEDLAVLSLNADATMQLDADDVHRLFYGAEAVHNDVQSTGYILDINSGARTPTSTRYPDGGSTMTTLAAYLTWRWHIAPQWSLNSGLRYSHILLEASFEDKTFYDFPFDALEINTGALNGGVGLVFRPEPDFALNVNLSSGFRAPNVDDAGKVFDSSPGSVMVPNPDLAPEYAYNMEVGVEKTFASSVHVNLVGWYTQLTDAIVRRDFRFNGQDSIMYDGTLSQVQANVNAGEARVYGASASFLADVNSMFSIASSVTWTHGRDVSEDVPLGHIPPVFGQTRLIYRRDRFRGEFALRYNGWKHIEEYSPTGEDNETEATIHGTPAWLTLDLRASYQLSELLQLNVGVENLLDEHYRPFSSGVSAAGRNLVLALRAMF
ncbi:MAG: TonB-dependent receptor [Bacteroidota bacterium]|nr:TonB-dependent receptor [Bacteroidota bacterium]